MADPREFLFKVIVVGEANVGKTSIVHRYVEGTFSSKYKYTIGVDFALKVLNIDDSTVVRLQLWDIAGQDRFGVMTHVYYKESRAAVVVFDLTSARSFEYAARWKKDIDSKVMLPNGQTVPTILLANKSDLTPHAVTRDELRAFVSANGFLAWFEVSAKENRGLDSAFRFLVSHMLASEGATAAGPPPDPDAFKLKDTEPTSAAGGADDKPPSSCLC